MPINLDLDKNGDLVLLDAIAYEFFMDHINEYIDETKEEVGEQLAKLATVSFQVGEIFVLSRNKYYLEQTNDTDS